MPRRNRNAGTPRPDTDQLAAEVAQFAADLRPGFLTGHGKSTLLLRYLARTVPPGCLVVVTGGPQPLPHRTPLKAGETRHADHCQPQPAQ